jgi:ketosteroid isomerase-like protein
MPPDVDHFLERFFRFGAAPSVATYLDLFDPDATLFDSGMPRPIRVPEIPEHIEGILRLVPDFHMTPERWRAHGPTLFVEAANQASLAGKPLRWHSVYCMDLTGDRVARGRRYYDRRPLFASLNAALPALPAAVLRAGGDPLPAPGSAEAVRPAFARRLEACFPGLSLTRVAAAGDDLLRFVEWRIDADVAGEAFSFGAAERIDVRAGNARAYFDTLALATRLAALGAQNGRAA